MSRLAVLSLLLAASAPHAEAPGFHVGLDAGIGVGYALAGVHLQLRYSHVALFAGTGLLATAGFDNRTGVVGLRGYLGEQGDRFFVSTQFLFTTWRQCENPGCMYNEAGSRSRTNVLTALAGWRFKWRSVCLDLGAGGGVVFEDPRYAPQLVPDLTLAVGWEF